MLFLGSEKQAVAKELCLHQLMKRKPAISPQHFAPPQQGAELPVSTAWEKQTDTTRDQSWGAHRGSVLE